MLQGVASTRRGLVTRDGTADRNLARRLFLTESTVKLQLRSAYKVLGVSNRTEAARLFRNDSEAPVIPAILRT
jgi:DNA-binding NarL/FixJ family response regulator